MKKFMGKLFNKNNEHVIIFDSNSELEEINFYKIPNITNSFEFNPDLKLEIDEWFFIELSDEQITKMLDEYKECLIDSTSFNKINTESYKDIGCLYLIEKNDDNIEIIFTRITNSYFVSNKRFLSFGPETKVVKQDNTITFSGYVDAYFDGNKKIYFKSFSKVKPLFKDFDIFYKKATEEEKNKFLEDDFFIAKKDISKVIVGERNLRKISYLLNEKKIDLSNEDTRKKYIEYAKKYPELNIKISPEDGKLEFEDNKDISNIISLLEENFYITPITGEKREVAVSKKIKTST